MARNTNPPCQRCGQRRKHRTRLHDDMLRGEIDVCLKCAKALLPFKGVRYVSGAFPVMRRVRVQL